MPWCLGGASSTTTSREVLYLGWKLLHCLDSLEVLLGMGPKLDRHVDGIFFGEPLAIEERTVLFPSSYKRIGTERLGGVIPSVDPGQFLKALPPLLSKHLLLTRQLLEGAEEEILWRRCHCGGDASTERRKERENTLEAMPAQIPTDLCIGTCGHLNE